MKGIIGAFLEKSAASRGTAATTFYTSRRGTSRVSLQLPKAEKRRGRYVSPVSVRRCRYGHLLLAFFFFPATRHLHNYNLTLVSHSKLSYLRPLSCPRNKRRLNKDAGRKKKRTIAVSLLFFIIKNEMRGTT